MEDEELVKALKFAIEQKELDWAGYWDEKYQWIEFSMKDVFDVIQRLQAKNKGLQERGEKIINGLYETIDKKQAEIERLTVENAELQKQLDEWNSAFIPTRARQQAVKDTAKEIGIIAIQLSNMCESFYEFQNRLIDLIEVNYSVEIVQETIIPTNGVEVE